MINISGNTYIDAVPLTFGLGTGQLLVLTEPISFWGGIDARTGQIVDAHHPQRGVYVTNKVMFLTSSRGSSTGSYVLLELMRAKIAPSAIVLTEPDGIICTGVLVGGETYDLALPVIQVPISALTGLKSGVTGKVVSEENHAFLSLE